MLQNVPDLGLTTPALAVAVLLPTAAPAAHMRYHRRTDPNDMVASDRASCSVLWNLHQQGINESASQDAQFD